MDLVALVGVGDLISWVQILVGVGDVIDCTGFAHMCGFGNSWRFEDTRSIPIGSLLAPYCLLIGQGCGFR